MPYYPPASIVIGSPSGIIEGNTADGATAVSVIVDSVNSLANAGAKLLSVRNQGTEKFYITSTGLAVVAATAATYTCASGPVVVLQSPAATVYFSANQNAGAILYAFGLTATLNTLRFAVDVPVDPSADLLTSCGESDHRWTAVWAVRHLGAEQTVSWAASVTFTLAAGSFHRITLTDSISAWSIAAGAPGERVRIEFIQDGSGTRTLAGAGSTIKLAGGALTLSTGAGKRDLLTFSWDNADSLWLETSRALNM